MYDPAYSGADIVRLFPPDPSFGGNVTANLPAVVPTGGQILARLVLQVEAKHGLPPGSIKGRSHIRRIVHARHEFFHLAYEVRRTGGRRRFSYPAIGNFMRGPGRPQGMDHTSIISGRKAFCRRRRVWLVALKSVGIA